MAQNYTKVGWKDHILDGTKVLQQGTPVSASNLNKMDAGIELAHQKLEGSNRQTQAISHGLQMLNGDVNAPISLQMEGRTLTPLQNSVLEAGKYYLQADKKTWFAVNGTGFKGIQKFSGLSGNVNLTRIANYEGKIPASTLENPHIAKRSAGGQAGFTSLRPPTDFINEIEGSNYALIASLNGQVQTLSCENVGGIAQVLYSFNLIEEVERNLGRIPGNTTAQKVQWLKENIGTINFLWTGWGNSPAGNKATTARYQANQWVLNSAGFNNTASSPAQNKSTIGDAAGLSATIQADGWVHFLSYAEPATAGGSSIIYPDYAEIQIELKVTAALHAPRVPLYEVTKEHYDAALVTWNEDEVMRRYPMVEGVQHIQNPYVMAEGDNLIPPFSEWSLVSNQGAVLLEAYKFEINPTSNYAHSWSPNIPVIPNEIYTLYGECDHASGYYTTHIYDKDGKELANNGRGAWRMPATAAYVRIRATNGTAIAKMTFFNVILAAGGNTKPFVPRNPSYLFAETKLGAIGTTKDFLFEQDGKLMVRKSIEKDIALDGSKAWAYHSNQLGNITAKIFAVALPLPVARSGFLTKYNGKVITNVVPNEAADTYNGLNATGDIYLTTSCDDMGLTVTTYVPTNDEIKAYFNGWKAKTVDANGKPTAWKSIVDGTDASTQTLAYVAANKATGYTPYMLSYVLSTPIVSEVKNEGSLSVNGPTQIEVGSGVVIREKASFALNGQGTSYNINSNTIANTSLSNRVGKFLALYKGSSPVKEYFISRDQFAIGNERLGIDKDKFDTTADYYVTYLVYDRNKFTSNPLTASATFANSIRTALDDNIKVTEDNKREISIQALQIYNMLVRLKAGGI